MKTFFSYTILFCYILLSISCHHGSVPQKTTGLNTPNRSLLEQPPYDAWFNKNYTDYTVDTITAQKLRATLIGKQLVIFMGTWCGDSRREVPRFYKIMQYCGIDTASIRLDTISNAANTYKQSPGHEEKGMDIRRVPVFIVLEKKRELGRIVESPVVSLEKDLLSIAAGEPYTPNYPAGAYLAQLFRRKKLSRLREQLPELTEKLRPLVKSAGELSSYAHVLDAAGEPDKASLVRDLKSRLFPGG